jgi:ABC-type spermidine/putrescine transport system permease subunit II
MAPGYMGWTVLALVVGLVVFGLPALVLARRARADEQAGNLERASRRSYGARTVAIVTVVCMAVIWIAVYARAMGA